MKESLFQRGPFSKSNPILLQPSLFPSLNKVNTFTYAARVSLGRDVRTANNLSIDCDLYMGIEAFCRTQVSSDFYPLHLRALIWKFTSPQISLPACHMTFSFSLLAPLVLVLSSSLFPILSFSFSSFSLFVMFNYCILLHQWWHIILKDSHK